MPTTAIKSISARELKAALHDGGEIALLDAREEAAFGARHHLMASCVPLSRLELMLDDLCRAAPRASCGATTATVSALRAAARMSGARLRRRRGAGRAASPPGKRQGTASTAASTCRARRSPKWSSTRPKTPWISAPELQAMIDSERRHRDLRQPLVRGIPQQQHPDRHQRARCGARLSLRRSGAVARHAVIVNCGGRTRSIIGAQSLIATPASATGSCR